MRTTVYYQNGNEIIEFRLYGDFNRILDQVADLNLILNPRGEYYVYTNRFSFDDKYFLTYLLPKGERFSKYLWRYKAPAISNPVWNI